MKNLFKSLLTIVTVLISSFGFSQNENALLWKVSGNGLEKPSYVFGTIHMICQDDYFLNENVSQALKNSEALFTEINFGNMEEMLLMQKSVQTDIPLKERISEKKYKKLESLLKEKLNTEIISLEKLSEAGIASMIMMKSFSCDNIKMYEIELLQKAMSEKKQLGGLETVKEQLKIMEDHLNIDACIKMLEELKSSEDSNRKMVELYKAQNIDELLQLLNSSSYMNEKAYHEFVVNRNNNWVTKMPELMKNKSVFFAVGAAHLGSKDGVLDLLRKNGYTVEALN